LEGRDFCNVAEQNLKKGDGKKSIPVEKKGPT